MPIGRAASLAGCHRVSAMRWLSLGAAEIAEAGDNADELGPRAAFAISFEEARASYLLELSEAWRAAVAAKDANTAKAVAAMLSSQSPDEFSERRAVRSIDQRTTLAGEISVSRFDTMTDDALRGEREKIAARVAAGEAGAGAASWQDAAVRLPSSPVGTEDDPDPVAGENNSTVEKRQSGSQTRKTQVGGFSVDDPADSGKNMPTRARTTGAPVVDDPVVMVPAGSAPGRVGGGGVAVAGAPPPPPLSPPDDDEDTKL